jgi:uracil-DNA glycosylase family 4
MMTIEELKQVCSSCRLCPLWQSRTKVVIDNGNQAADIMFVGEAPGEQEDFEGLPFVGRAGELLWRIVFEEMGETRGSFWVSNAVKCRPPANATPTSEQVRTCREFLLQEIAFIRPVVIVTLGAVALSALVPGSTQRLRQVRGKTMRVNGTFVVPTYHPSFLIRRGIYCEELAEFRADLVRAKLLAKKLRAET